MSEYVKGTQATLALLRVTVRLQSKRAQTLCEKAQSCPDLISEQVFRVSPISLFSGKTGDEDFNSAKLSNEFRHAYLQSLAQDGRIPHTVIA